MGPIKNARRDTMDTVRFNDLSSQEYKKQTQKHWTSVPCGSNYSDKEFLSKEFFDEIGTHRYATHPWIIENIRRFNIKGKKVLEIGCGMGTDHLAMARQGGEMVGIDLTPKNLAISKNRFEIYGFSSGFVVGDAENLPLKNESFDFVYSFGVIHHSPDTQRIVSEIYRILKCGGRCWVTVYHKNSIYFWLSVFTVGWLLHGRFLRESIKQQMSRIEYPNNNPNLVIRLYRRKEFEKMFNGFRHVSSSIDHLVSENISYIGKYIPARILSWLGKRFGWYVIIEAIK